VRLPHAVSAPQTGRLAAAARHRLSLALQLLNGSGWKRSQSRLGTPRANWSRTTGEESPQRWAFRWAILGSNQ
jgi:hypothetical protein